MKTSIKTLIQAQFETPLGPMVVVADDTQLYLLEFIERRGLQNALHRLSHWAGAAFETGTSPAIESIQEEMRSYFSGHLQQFTTSVVVSGTPFQRKVWTILQQIPYGETQSYLAQAQILQSPKSFRAVANANGANQFAILIPCHRVIRANGALGGYGGGIQRKQWLLDHESACRSQIAN